MLMLIKIEARFRHAAATMAMPAYAAAVASQRI